MFGTRSGGAGSSCPCNTCRNKPSLWCREVAGQRQCRPLGGAAPLSVFEAVEASELQPLPHKRFVLATWSTGTIGPDIHVRVGKSLYSVPWRHIGRRVDARETPTVVQIFDNGQLIATHGRRPAGKSTDLSHYPPEKIAFAMRTPTWCRSQAGDIGPACVAVIGGLLEVNALFRLRAAQGVLGLAGKHGPARLEKACARAIEVGDPTYRTVKGILAAGTEADPPRPRPATVVPRRTCMVLRSCSRTSWPCPPRTHARRGPRHHERRSRARCPRRARRSRHPRPHRARPARRARLRTPPTAQTPSEEAS